MNIRTASTIDYAEIVRINNAALPHYTLSVEQLQNRDAANDPKCQLGYLVAEVDTRAVGFASYAQWIDMYHPQIFHVAVRVEPPHQQQGIGMQLHHALSETLAPFRPISFKSAIYDGDIGAKTFSQNCGYQEYSRRIESRLDVAGCDLSAWLPRLEQMSNAGIQLIPMSQLMHDEQALRAIYDLQWVLELDVPLDEVLTQPTFEQWRTLVVDRPDFVPAASFVAQQAEQYVGLTEVFQYNDELLYIEFTGTLATHRRQGIARAMKILGMQWAQQNAFPQMGTTNDAVNTGVIDLNRALGFIPNPARIQIEKSF